MTRITTITTIAIIITRAIHAVQPVIQLVGTMLIMEIKFKVFICFGIIFNIYLYNLLNFEFLDWPIHNNQRQYYENNTDSNGESSLDAACLVNKKTNEVANQQNKKKRKTNGKTNSQ